jgi:cell division protein ZapA
MPTVNFEINGKDYSVDCGAGQEGQILGLARSIDERAREMARRFDGVDSETLLLMACILLAGDLERARAKAAGLEKTVDAIREGAIDEDRLAEFALMLCKKVKEMSGAVSNMLDME